MEKDNIEDTPYIYRWRIKNKQRYLEISRAGSAKYYESNKEKKKAYALAYYYRKKAEKVNLEHSDEKPPIRII